MQQDAHGLAITASSSAAAGAFDYAIAGYTSSRADVAARVQAALAADPEFGLAHCLQGYLAMSAFNVASLPVAEHALRRHDGTVGSGPTGNARMWTRLPPGLPGIRTKPAPSGRRSWATIRTMFLHSGSRISSISGLAGPRRCWKRPARSRPGGVPICPAGG